MAPRAAPQMAAPRAAPQRIARPSGGGGPPAAVTRRAPPAPKTFAAPQHKPQQIARPDRGGPTAREALRAAQRDKPAAQKQETVGARSTPRDNLARERQQATGAAAAGAAAAGAAAAGAQGRLDREQQGRLDREQKVPGKVERSFQLAGDGKRDIDGKRGISDRVLRNPAFASRSTAAAGPAGRALARATFQGSFADRHGGRFAGKDWKHRRHVLPFVIGWVGPLFWPYADDDFVSYTFYPYAYDTFWPSAYDDVYVGMFGPYAVSPGGTYAAVESGGTYGSRGYESRGRPQGAGRVPVTTAADLCSGQTSGLTDWPIERIAQTVAPDDTQRAALEALRDAAAKALDILKASCPTELPSTPTGRLDAMQARLDAMLQAVRTVRPALEAFHQSLNDEQKARFNALGPEDARDQQQAQRELSQACGERAAGIGSLPIERIERSVQPNETQRSALAELRNATAEAVELLRSNCPSYRPLTAIGRLEAMEQRIEAMLQAVQTVQPALERFYGSLSDEQKERFNRLSPRAGVTTLLCLGAKLLRWPNVPKVAKLRGWPP